MSEESRPEPPVGAPKRKGKARRKHTVGRVILISALVLFGVLGGLIAFGFLGIFLGPTLLALGYALFEEWSAEPRSAASEVSEEKAPPSVQPGAAPAASAPASVSRIEPAA